MMSHFPPETFNRHMVISDQGSLNDGTRPSKKHSEGNCSTRTRGGEEV